MSIHSARMRSPGLRLPTESALMAVFQYFFTRQQVREYVAQLPRAPGKRGLYWRAWTPLVTLWGMLTQRLTPARHTEDVTSAFAAGAADALDAADRHAQPLSVRLRSEHNSAYVQARERLPLGLIRLGREHVQQAVAQAQAEGADAGWHGLPVRLLDGTTYRLRPAGDLVKTYGQTSNQHTAGYWVTVKSVAAFDLTSRTVVGHAEGPRGASEAGLVRAILAADPQPDSLYLGDSGYGYYRVAQVADALHHPLLVRVDARRVGPLLRAAGRTSRLNSGDELRVTWTPEPGVKTEPDLPKRAIVGRLIYARLTRPGFRPIDLYLFTTLLDAETYPATELIALYAQRYEVELHYRDVKTTLGMEEFDVRSDALFQRELEVGLLTFNLISALMGRAATQAGIPLAQLSFTRCLTRIRDTLTLGVPAWVLERYAQPLDWLVERLTKCRLPTRRPRVARALPRAVRRRPVVFPALKGSRAEARQQLMETYTAVADTMNSE